MKLNISNLLNIEGSIEKIDASIKISDDYFSDLGILFKDTINISGSISNVRGVLVLNLKAYGKYIALCARCLKEITLNFDFDINQSFIKEESLTDNDEYEIISGTTIDIEKIVNENILLSLDSKNLCSDDCKGLCQICGANLNNNDCGCEVSNWDERFDILKDLF